MPVTRSGLTYTTLAVAPRSPIKHVFVYDGEKRTNVGKIDKRHSGFYLIDGETDTFYRRQGDAVEELARRWKEGHD